MEIGDDIMARAILRRGTLHPLLQASVCDTIATGDYDIAVRDAFVLVDRVKVASGIEGEIGVSLMRAAFDPNGGPQTLTDMSRPVSERERIVDLVVGAIATFKDPISRKVLGSSCPATVFEVLMVASELPGYLP
jgi:Protein of unknown function (Hypoth_ymh)